MKQQIMYDPWILGIVSGIISSFISTMLIWIVVRFWEDTIFPRYAKIMYRGIKVEDTWLNERKVEGEIVTKGRLDITQIGPFLEGKLVITIFKDRTEHNYTYKVKGEIINNYVKLDATANDERNFTFTCGIFELINNGRSLKGSSVLIDNFTSEISSRDDIYWHRD